MDQVNSVGAIRETRNHIKSTMTLALGIYDGSVIDFETTGRPQIDSECEVVTLGYFHGNDLVVIQRKAKEKEPFYKEVREALDNLPKPFYSYNARFEHDVMKYELKMNVSMADFVDIMGPWKTKADKAGLKWPKLDELISEPEDYFHDNKISGKDVPGLWKAYLMGGTEGLLRMMMDHSLSDLLRETVLLVRYELS
jgi:uncharacterized protein YprB with RNaseH-like and TPR domain